MKIAKLATVAALGGLALSGCVASRYQISDALMRYGMNENQASCASEFLHGHLSTRQVNRLADAARYYDTGGRMTFGDLIRVAGRVNDPEVLAEVGAAALACKVGADIPLPRFR